MKQYSAACDQNKDPILKVIKPLLLNAKSVLEVGSGTGPALRIFCQRITTSYLAS